MKNPRLHPSAEIFRARIVGMFLRVLVKLRNPVDAVIRGPAPATKIKGWGGPGMVRCFSQCLFVNRGSFRVASAIGIKIAQVEQGRDAVALAIRRNAEPADGFGLVA